MKNLKTGFFSMAVLLAILIFFETASMAAARPEKFHVIL
jgi:hypothetical protein